MKDVRKIKNIHFLGIGGIGISALAKLFLYWKADVSGSDIQESEITKELNKRGAKIYIGHKKENIAVKTNLVVYSSAVSNKNPERQEAKKRNIQEISYFEFIGQLSGYYKTIAVCGAHGKSTVTALLGQMLIDSDVKPLIIVGTKVPNWKDENLYYAPYYKNQYFILESCEYQKNFLKINPYAAIITNIDNDHLDTYKDLDEIKKTFYRFASKVSSKGFLTLNGQDKNSEDLFKIKKNKIIAGRDYKIRKDNKNDLKFIISKGKETIGRGKSKLFGDFNLENILMASITAVKLGVKWPMILESIAKFPGIWRRAQFLHSYKKSSIYSDYAHHPTAIKKTLKAFKNHFAGKKIIVIFQPHQIDRTNKLFKDFTQAWQNADKVFILETYNVAGRDSSLKSEARLVSIRLTKKIGPKAIFISNLNRAFKLFKQQMDRNSIGIIMGAGSIHNEYNSKSKT